MLDGLKSDDPTFQYEIETPPPASYRVQTMYMNPFDVPKDQPIVQALESNLRDFTGRDFNQVGAVVTQSYAGNDSCHIWEAGRPGSRVACMDPRAGGTRRVSPTPSWM